MAPAEPRAPLAAYRVDFIDKDDAGSVLLALLKKIPYPGGADPDEHLHEVRSGNRKEGNSRLARNRLGQKGLSRSRGAQKNDALGDFPAKLLVFLGVFEEVHHFHQFGLGLVYPGHVGKGDLLGTTGHEPGTALSKGQGTPAASLGLSHGEKEEPEQKKNGAELEEDGRPNPLLLGRLGGHGHILFQEKLGQFRVMVVRLDHGEIFPGFGGSQDHAVLGMDIGLLHVPSLHLGDEFGIIPGVRFFGVALGLLDEIHEDHENDQEKGDGFIILAQGKLLSSLR